MAGGTAIGSGVITLCGVGIMNTGFGAGLAYMLAGLLICFAVSPLLALGSVFPRNGGSYTYIRECLNPYWGAMYLVVFTVAKIGLAMFCVSMAEYLINGVFGMVVDRIVLRIVAFVIVTLFYFLNLQGQKAAVKIQNLMTLVLLLALVSFAVIGLFRVDFSGQFTAENLFPNGSTGFTSALCVLVFGVIGGIGVVDYGTNIENPKRSIPVIALLLIIGTAILNGIIAFVAAVAAPLTAPASHLLYAADAIGGPVYQRIFVFCGAVLALASTINGNFPWFRTVMSRGIEDRLLPQSLGKTNRKGSTYVLYTILYVVAVIILLLDMETALLANVATGLSLLFTIIPNIALIFAPSRYAEEWNKSRLPKNRVVVTVWALASTAVGGFLVGRSILNYTVPTQIALGAVFVVGIIYAIIVGGKAKKEGNTHG